MLIAHECVFCGKRWEHNHTLDQGFRSDGSPLPCPSCVLTEASSDLWYYVDDFEVYVRKTRKEAGLV